MFIKICGITTHEDAHLALEVGADAVGFVFVPRSPRYLPLERAAAISRRLPPHVARVGLFVDSPLRWVQQVAQRCELTHVQLHGDESPHYCDQVGRPVLKAFRVRDAGSLTPMERYSVSAYLLDAYVPGKSGGTGKTFDWEYARQAAAERPVILAGGLRPGNVAEAIRMVRPYGVDVSSGVEREPGRKDAAKVRAFIRSAREAWDALDHARLSSSS